jgi:8-oxo-dGTP pyrophosphatase MutT (NUDIX family)
VSRDELIDASTVLLLRDDPEHALQVFMVRRHGNSRFMGGKYVFPGGKLDPGDATLDLEPFCEGLNAVQAAAILGDAEPERALGLFVAAIRETFEEANILLGSGRDLNAARVALQHGDTNVLTLARAGGWSFDLGGLRYFSHWITPPVEPRRFSARFFLVRAPSDQVAEHDSREVTDGVWISPHAALGQYADGVLDMAPPTLRVLERLHDQPTVDAALASAPHEPLTAQSPRFVSSDTPMLVLDGDRLHPTAPGDMIRRFRLIGGRWVSEFPPASAL